MSGVLDQVSGPHRLKRIVTVEIVDNCSSLSEYTFVYICVFNRWAALVCVPVPDGNDLAVILSLFNHVLIEIVVIDVDTCHARWSSVAILLWALIVHKLDDF